MLKKLIKIVEDNFPWTAFAAALAAEFAVAFFVFRHNSGISGYWEFYLDFSLLVAFILIANFFVFRKRRK